MQTLALPLLTTLLAFAAVPLPSSADHDVEQQAESNELADGPNSITLRINTIPDVATPAGYPVTTGVPFADGQLREDELHGLRLLGRGGEPVPAQFEVRGRYLRSKNVRWPGVDFQSEPGAKQYPLEMTDGPGPAHPTPVRVESTGDAFIVTTGELKAGIPKVGMMLRRVWLAGEAVVEQGPRDGNWLRALDGQLHRERAEQAVIERNGPLHATIRIDGRYVDPEGKPSCKWTARRHFFAGLPARCAPESAAKAAERSLHAACDAWSAAQAEDEDRKAAAARIQRAFEEFYAHARALRRNPQANRNIVHVATGSGSKFCTFLTSSTARLG